MRLLATFAAVIGLAGSAWAGTINVTPANMNGWTLNSFDDNGNIVNSGPYAGPIGMVTGPAVPPLGVGSAHLVTPVGAGDGAAAIATEGYDGTLLTSITSLSYYAYDSVNNGQQFPYLAVSVDLGDVNNTLDTLFFEPPYQTPATGNPSLPNQGNTVQNQWQLWNAYVGGFWDNNANFNPGTGVGSLAAFEALFPNATIANGGFPGLGGIALQVGFGSPGETEDGNVDDFTIGINGVNTSYNFDPSAPVPLPRTALGGALLLGAIGLWRLNQRRSLSM